jgi:hypothetical protein
MNIDMDLVRQVLKKLYIAPAEEHSFPEASHLLSPPSIPGYEDQSDIIGEHVDLMVLCGFIERERIGMKPPPDFVGLKPTSDARKWFNYALDDQKWAGGSAELEEKLRQYQSE